MDCARKARQLPRSLGCSWALLKNVGRPASTEGLGPFSAKRQSCDSCHVRAAKDAALAGRAKTAEAVWLKLGQRCVAAQQCDCQVLCGVAFPCRLAAHGVWPRVMHARRTGAQWDSSNGGENTTWSQRALAEPFTRALSKSRTRFGVGNSRRLPWVLCREQRQ